MIIHRWRTAAVVVAATVALAGCSGGDAPGDDVSAAERLTQAHDAAVKAGTFHIELTSDGLPKDNTTSIHAATGDGTIEPPAFQGTFSARMAGVQADVPVIATGGKLWVKLPYVGKYVETKPSDLNVPDPATLLDKDKGLIGLLPRTEEPEFGGRSRVGGDVVQEVKGKLPGNVVRDLLWVGDADAQFDVTYSLVEKSWEAREVRITGPFYPPGEATYTLVLTRYGDPVTIETP